MKRLFLISLLSLFVVATAVMADGKKGNELQRKSELIDDLGTTGGMTSTYPAPFNVFNQKYSQRIPAASMGYYFFDSEEMPALKPGQEDIWSTSVSAFDTTYQPKYWVRIVSGPRQWDESYWESNPFGRYYFRNPADELDGSIYDTRRDDLDSTDNAIAGPMPMGIRDGFYFNGIRYDSFYVSTNGVIALTNRRYIYNEKGEKEIPPGADHCYDINSMDWFVGGAATDYPNGTRARIENNNGDPSDGIDDNIEDNFGYRYSVLGSNPHNYYIGETALDDPIYTKDAGIRNDMFKKRNLLDIFDDAYETQLSRPALIAPFWTQIRLSQYNKTTEKPEGYSKVYFKHSPDGNTLTVAYYNISMWGQLQEPPTGKEYTLDPDSRPGEAGYFEWDAKVIFDRLDSSITFFYEDMRGEGKNNGATAGDMLRANSIIGVLGWARETNYSTKDPDQAVGENDPNYPWASEYMQYTHYSSRYLGDINEFPANGASIKFKQWKNVVRAADLAFRVRDERTADNPNLNFTVNVDDAENYELLAGEQLLGAIQPIGVVQNMSNETQGPKGVNFTPQDYEFFAQFSFQNTTTGRIVYSKTIPVSDACFSVDGHNGCFPEQGANVQIINNINTDYTLGSTNLMSTANYNNTDFDGLPPYYMAQVTYPAFEANEFIDNHIGRLKGTLVARPWKSGEDQWPFDDEVSSTIYVMKRLQSFSETASDYHTDVNTGIHIPSPMRWVTVNADVISGDEISQHPLPPRGIEDGNTLSSPVIRMNRTKTLADGTQVEDPSTATSVYVPYEGNVEYFGDELRSFPIDLRQKYDAVVSLSVQRGDNYYDGWVTGLSRFRGDEILHGPEARVVNNFNFKGTALSPGYDTDNNRFIRYPDMLVVEFARPSYDGVQDICNIPEANWRYHAQKRGTNEAPITGIPALTLFGGGGRMDGFLEEDPDSALARPDANNLYGLDPDIYDTGVDFDFTKYFITVPDTIINWQNDGARNFRFRIRTLAKDNQINPQTPTEADDNDDFFVDNVKVTFPSAKTDISVTSVKIDWKYAFSPASQLTQVPVSVTLSNNTAKTAPVFYVKLKIYRTEDFDKEKVEPKEDSQNPGKPMKPIYCRLEHMANFQGGREYDLQMPAWNIRKHGEGDYTLVAYVVFPGQDLYTDNDITYSDQKIGFGTTYQYESTTMDMKPLVDAEGSEILDNDGNVVMVNSGRNDIDAANNGFDNYLLGMGLSMPAFSQGTNVGQEQQVGAGYGGTDSYAGKIAVKFNVVNTDTIRGYNVFFGSINGAPDLVEFDIVENQYDQVINQDMPTTTSVKGAYCQHERGWFGDPKTPHFDEYNIYYLDEPLELPAGTYWMVMTQTAPDAFAVGGSADRVGMRVTNYNNVIGTSMFTDRTLRTQRTLPDGESEMVNGNYFCYSNGNSGDNWQPFTPNEGNLAYPHTNHDGLNQNDGQTRTFFNGTWIPMFQPYFGPRVSGMNKDEYSECPDNPVELNGFFGKAVKGGIELLWETASENNNSGFEVERKAKEGSDWNILGFVAGNGNSAVTRYYSYLDEEVVAGETYTYRLRQIDKDGSVSCDKSREVTVAYDFNGETQLAQNSPNPVKYRTSIRFELAESCEYKLEVIDLYGNLVKVLAQGSGNAGNYNAEWYGLDANGASVANGTYFYRLTAGDKVITNKMTLLK